MDQFEIREVQDFGATQMQIVYELEKVIFEDPITPEVLNEELRTHTGTLALIAYSGSQPCGFKIGYAQSSLRFYSWIGGVHPSFRNKGLAKALMAKQHELLVKSGYKFAVTHTHNKYLGMLLLNLKSGFQITGTKTNLNSDAVTIILEKALT